ncbi:MAG: hypothetical protein WBJ00_05620 [Dethiobacteria bacterium]
MSELMEKAKEIETVICQVQGVLSSRVVFEGEEIVEVHVLADHTRSPKQIVRDIESAVMVKSGTHLDHKRISVAQLGHEGRHLVNNSPRLLLYEIAYASQGGEIRVTVTVTLGEDRYSFTCKGPYSSKNRLRLVAKSTIGAVEEYLGTDSRLVVDDIKKVSLTGQEAVIVSITYFVDSREETLLGVALIRDGDDREAAAKASLDAINRRLLVINNSD